MCFYCVCYLLIMIDLLCCEGPERAASVTVWLRIISYSIMLKEAIQTFIMLVLFIIIILVHFNN
jgi:hypothetical protein